VTGEPNLIAPGADPRLGTLKLGVLPEALGPVHKRHRLPAALLAFRKGGIRTKAVSVWSVQARIERRRVSDDQLKGDKGYH
jgi:hypothetical protein